MASNKYQASHTSQATIMRHVALQPGELTRPDIIGRGDINKSSVMQASYVLLDRGLLEEGKSRPAKATGRPGLVGYPAPLLSPTERFWETYEAITETTTELSPNDRELYEEAVTRRYAASLAVEGTVEHDRALSGYLGRTIVLGGRCNLNPEDDSWFDGIPGWQTFVTITALSDRSPLSEVLHVVDRPNVLIAR